MTPADETRFVQIIVGLSSQKPGKPLTPEGIDLFWRSMQTWDIEAFAMAAEQLNRTHEFMPNAFHFEQLRRATEQTASEAWTSVLANVRSGEYHRGITVGGKVDRVVRAMGGYQAIGMTNSDQIHFRERRFAELWTEFGEADAARQAVPLLGESMAPSGQSAQQLIVSLTAAKRVE